MGFKTHTTQPSVVFDWGKRIQTVWSKRVFGPSENKYIRRVVPACRGQSCGRPFIGSLSHLNTRWPLQLFDRQRNEHFRS